MRTHHCARGTRPDVRVRRSKCGKGLYALSECPGTCGTTARRSTPLPFALAGSGSFRTLPFTNHFETNRKVIEAFLPVNVRKTKESRSEVLVEIG